MKSHQCTFIYLLFSLFLHSFLVVVGAEVFNMDSNDLMEPESNRITPFFGKHFTVMLFWFRSSMLVLERDETGNVVKTSGLAGLAFEYLAQSLHFTFEYVYDDHHPLYMEDQNEQKPGIINIFLHSNADVMMGAFGYTPSRNKVIDYTLPTAVSSMALLIPKPTIQKTNYALAIVKPFQLQVWLWLVISFAVGVTSLYLIWRGISCIQRRSNTNDGKDQKKMSEIRRFGNAINAMFGLIILQGSFACGALRKDRKLLAVRFLIGAWCLTCFVLVTAYSSVLVSFMTAPEIYKPIINSVNDLATKPDVHVTVTKGMLADVIFQSAMVGKPNGIFKFIGEELSLHPEQRCTSTDKCLDQVRQGSSVYIFPESVILNMIGEDWKKNGQCDFTIAKERFLMTPGSAFLLKKNSPYTEEFSRIILRMHDVGLINFWLNANAMDPTHCLKKIDQEMNQKKSVGLKRLTLSGLSGAFIVLGIGYSLAIAAFIVEVVHSYMKNIKNRNSTDKVTIQPSVVAETVLVSPKRDAAQNANDTVSIIDVESNDN